MGEQTFSLRELFFDAENKRNELEGSYSSNSATYQENLSSAIATYEECLRVASQVSLFSSNEAVEDVASGDLTYMLIDYHIAELVQKITGGDRKLYLLRARASYDKFLGLLDSYDVLSRSDVRLYERYQESPNSFSTASKVDAAARRETKIARFREERELKQKLERLRQDPMALRHDDAALRELHLANVRLCIHQTFQSLESIAQELEILGMAPPAPPPGQQRPDDPRQRGLSPGGYSERLDPPLSQLLANSPAGPILSKDGKPLRPFTLLDSRHRLQRGVFRPGHNLPTMTIDEYLEEERKRGGIIEGGGEKSAARPEPDEDDMEKADEETMKARAWDEFKEENPKGSGNTLNRG